MLLCTILFYLPSRDIVFSRNREIEWDLSRVRGKEHNTSHHWSCWAWSATCRSRIVAETYHIRYTACVTWLWRGPTSIAPAKTSPVNKRQIVTRKCIWRSIANFDTKCRMFTQSLSRAILLLENLREIGTLSNHTIATSFLYCRIEKRISYLILYVLSIQKNPLGEIRLISPIL